MTENPTRVISIGDQLGPVAHTPTARQVVEYSVAANELAPYHYDVRAAAKLGVDRPIVNAGLKAAWFAQLLETWAGSGAVIRRLELSHRGMDLIEDPYRLEGQVVELDEHGDGLVATVALSGFNPSGTETVTGRASVGFVR